MRVELILLQSTEYTLRKAVATGQRLPRAVEERVSVISRTMRGDVLAQPPESAG